MNRTKFSHQLKLSFGDIQAFCRGMNVISVDIRCWSQPQKSSRNLTVWGESALTWSSKAAGRLSAGISILDFENLVISFPVSAGWQSIKTLVPKKLTWFSFLSCWLHPRYLSLLGSWMSEDGTQQAIVKPGNSPGDLLLRYQRIRALLNAAWKKQAMPCPGNI